MRTPKAPAGCPPGAAPLRYFARDWNAMCDHLDPELAEDVQDLIADAKLSEPVLIEVAPKQVSQVFAAARAVGAAPALPAVPAEAQEVTS